MTRRTIRAFCSTPLAHRIGFSVLALLAISALGKLGWVPGVVREAQPLFLEPCRYTWHWSHSEPCGDAHAFAWFGYEPLSTFWGDGMFGLLPALLAGVLMAVFVRWIFSR